MWRRWANGPTPLTAGCWTFQFLLILASSALHLKDLLYFIQYLYMFTGKRFLELSNLGFGPILLKFFHLQSAVFPNIHVFSSQLSPVLAITGKCSESANVMTEEKWTRKCSYPALASHPQKLYRQWVVMSRKADFTKTEVNFEMSQIQINWDKGDLDCHFTAEV